MKTIKIKNLAHLKKVLQEGAEYKILDHKNHKDAIGLIRKISVVQSNAVYSRIKDQPDHKYSVCNSGMGLRMDFGKASNYIFGDTVKYLHKSSDDVLYEFVVLDTSESEVECNA